MIWQLVLALLLGWLVVLRWKSRKWRMMTRKLKTDLSRFPVIGDLHHFVGDGQRRMKTLQSIGRTAIKNEGWSSMKLAHKFYGVVADPLEADYILKTHLEKDEALKVSEELIGNGLIFASVPIWRPRRKIMAPTFSQFNLNQFVDVFYEQSNILVDNLAKVADRQTFSVWNYFTSYSMDAIGQTTLGIVAGVQQTTDHIFLRSFQQYATIASKRLFNPWIQKSVVFKYLCYFDMYPLSAKCVNILQGFVNNVIEKKREELKPKEEEKKVEIKEDKANRKFKPILELLIEASGGENGYSNKELQEETLVILVAGTDTSSVGAGFLATMLARYPDIQEKCYKEIKEVFGDSDRAIKAEDLPKLSYLEAVLKETLRLYPPVPVTARMVLKEDVTPAGIQLVPGMGILVNHWAIQRNPKYWGEDADEFRPERFFDSPPTHPSAYVPFSSGPRSCLGYKYAMMSMMTVTASILRRFRILPPSDQDLDKPLKLTYEVMMKPTNNFLLKLENRT